MSLRRERSTKAENFGISMKLFMCKQAGMDVDAVIEREVAPEAAVRIFDAMTVKALVPGLTTGSAGALADFQNSFQAINAAAAHHGVFDRAFPLMIPASFHTKVGILTAVASAADVDQAMSIPVSRGVAARKSLTARKAIVIVVVTKEFLLHTDADVLAQLLALGLGAARDTQFVAHLSTGTALAAFGVEPRGIYVDIKRALSALATSSASEVMVAMGPAPAKRLCAMPTISGERAFPGMRPNGGELCGMPVVVTDALTSDVVLFDATAFMGASLDIELDRADQTTLEMASDPTSSVAVDGSPLLPNETTQVSLFQTNSVGLMATSIFGFEPLRAASVKLTGAGTAWGYDTTSSPPL